MSPSLIAFVIVGAIGFMVDAGTLTLLTIKTNLDLYSARIISFSLAVTLTWYINRNWVFAHHILACKKTEYKRYLIIQIVGASINLAVYSLCIHYFDYMSAYPVIPLAIGSSVAMFFNYYGAKLYVFTGSKKINI